MDYIFINILVLVSFFSDINWIGYYFFSNKSTLLSSENTKAHPKQIGWPNLSNLDSLAVKNSTFRVPWSKTNLSNSMVSINLIFALCCTFFCNALHIFLCRMLEINIVMYFQEWIIDMKGDQCPSIRSVHWKSKRVFFVTPQVLQNDIQSGDYF